MAVTSVQKLAEGWEAEISDDGKTAREMYQVLTDAVTSPVAILTADDGSNSIPSQYDAHPDDSDLTARRIGPPKIDKKSRLRWIVPVEYSDSLTDSSGGGGGDPNPLNDLDRINWGFSVYRKAAEKDRDDNPIVNSAGDPIVGLEDEEYLLKVVIEKNVASFSPADARAKIDTVNSNVMTIAGASVTAGQALMRDYSATAANRNGTAYVVLRFEIEFDEDFSREVLDVGFHILEGTATGGQINRKRITGTDGQPVRTPQKLNGSGGLGTTANYLSFDLKEESNWSSLSLPTTFPDT